jgi:hypothetical protein
MTRTTMTTKRSVFLSDNRRLVLMSFRRTAEVPRSVVYILIQESEYTYAISGASVSAEN